MGMAVQLRIFDWIIGHGILMEYEWNRNGIGRLIASGNLLQFANWKPWPVDR